MNNAKKIVIHCGPPKTGSSAIQNWMISNQEFLRKRGILYPDHVSDFNGISSGHVGLFLDRSDGESKFQHEKFLSLVEQFNSSNSEILFLSSEYFFYQIEEFFKYKLNYCFLVYVRPEIEYVESIYNQSVKRNGQTNPIEARKELACLTINRIIKLVSEYDSSRFMLRGYGAKDYFDNSIIQDVVEQCLGLSDFDELANSKKVVNPSYAFECLEFKRWLNRVVGTEFDNRLDPLLQSFSGGINQYSLLPDRLYENYRTQSINKIKELNECCGIKDVDKLIDYITSLVKGQYQHQSLENKHCTRVLNFIKRRNPKLLKDIVKKLSTSSLSGRDFELYRMFKRAARNQVHLYVYDRLSNFKSLVSVRLKR